MTIPAELRALPRWVDWRHERSTKVPYSPQTGRRASSTDPATWGRFEETSAARGIVLGDGLAGVDLDDCRDPHTGEIAPWAQAIILTLASYAEVSPSGTGIKIFLTIDPSWQPAGRKLVRDDGSAIEIYTTARYFTVTGDAVSPAPLAERTEALRTLMRDLFGADTSTPAGRPSWLDGYEAAGTQNITAADLPRSVADVSDADLLARMFAAENGDQVRALFEGDTRGDHSSADLALCSHLAFWTQRDPERIDRLFRRSRLMRTKWNRADYRARTIDRAVATSDIYEPPVVPIIAEAEEAEAL